MIQINNLNFGLLSVLLFILIGVMVLDESSDQFQNEMMSAEIKTSEFIFTEADFEQCHASTIVELPTGDLLVAWFGGLQEGDTGVAVWSSNYHKGKWSKPEIIADEAGEPCWNPVLFRDTENQIWLFFKVGPSPREWTGAYRISSDLGKSWSAINYLPAGLLGPIKNKPIIMTNNDIVCGTSVESYHAWSCWVEISSDNGKSWAKYGPITVSDQNYGIIQPTLWEMEPGHLKMLVRSKQIGYICQSTSYDGGKTWTAAEPTSLPNPNSGIDAVKMLDGSIALVYNHTQLGRSPLNVAFSMDNGSIWNQPLILEDQPGEYSYPAIIQTEDGDLHITYTWNRKSIKHVVLSVH